jgi:hypothetical protein
MTDDMALEPLDYSPTMKPFEIAAMSQAASFKRIADALEIMAERGTAPVAMAGMRRMAEAAPQSFAPAVDAEGFIAWPGRVKPPVAAGDEVIVRRRDGNVQQAFAGTLRWMWGSQVQDTGPNGELIPRQDQPGDIVAYKLVPPDPAMTMGT